MNNYVKDPIDFIRNFKLVTVKHHLSTDSKVSSEHQLLLRLVDHVQSFTVEVVITHHEPKACVAIADWLTQQNLFFVQPYALTWQDASNVTILHMRVNSFGSVASELVRNQLHDIVHQMRVVHQDWLAKNAMIISPSSVGKLGYGSGTTTSEQNHGGVPPLTLGVGTVSVSRAPNSGGVGRLPAGHSTNKSDIDF